MMMIITARGLGIVEAADNFAQHHADAAGADHAEHRGRAHVGFEAVERERDPQRQHLRDDAVDDLLQRCAPVARMPSTGRGSIASTASENSLARMPVVWTNRASTPAKGPRPTATTNSMAKTISLMARQASISRRTGW